MNKITANIHGSNTINKAGGIMIQKVKPGDVTEAQKKKTTNLLIKKGRIGSSFIILRLYQHKQLATITYVSR